jgi:hypothetical protein
MCVFKGLHENGADVVNKRTNAEACVFSAYRGNLESVDFYFQLRWGLKVNVYDLFGNSH